MLKTPLGRFRVIGHIEAVSFLVLLCIAMPLKYLADLPVAVLIVGSIHGALFLLYILAIVNVSVASPWPIGRVMGALAAAVLPFGPFVFDYWLQPSVPCSKFQAPS